MMQQDSFRHEIQRYSRLQKPGICLLSYRRSRDIKLTCSAWAAVLP